MLGRAHDVGEEHSGEDPGGVGASPDTGKEAFELLDDRIWIHHAHPVVVPGEFTQLCTRDVRTEIAPVVDADITVHRSARRVLATDSRCVDDPVRVAAFCRPIPRGS
jgi:hypothetical protein